MNNDVSRLARVLELNESHCQTYPPKYSTPTPVVQLLACGKLKEAGSYRSMLSTDQNIYPICILNYVLLS